MAGRMRRTQILLPEEHYRRLRQQAAARNCSLGHLVREALARQYLRRPQRARREAARRLVSMNLPVAHWPQMEREITRSRTLG